MGSDSSSDLNPLFEGILSDADQDHFFVIDAPGAPTVSRRYVKLPKIFAQILDGRGDCLPSIRGVTRVTS
jgi:hypothetical protein